MKYEITGSYRVKSVAAFLMAICEMRKIYIPGECAQRIWNCGEQREMTGRLGGLSEVF